MPSDKRPVIYDENLNFFRNFILQARLVWLLLLDPRVPLWLKAMPVGSLAYLVWPFELLPDSIPLLTQLDDIAVLLLGFRLFLDLCPAEVVAEHMQALTGQSENWKVESQSVKEAKSSSEITEPNVIEANYTEPPETE